MRILVSLAAVAAVGFVIGSIDGSLSQSIAGTGIAASIVLASLAIGLVPLARLASQPLAVALVLCLGAGIGATALLPVAETLVPGEPAADGDLKEVGDALELPPALRGPVRLLVHAKLPEPPARLRVDLAAGNERYAAALETTKVRVRLGRRGRGTAVQAHESTFIDANLQSGQLTLAHASGVWPVPLHVEVFREWLPDWTFLSAGAVLLCFAAFLGASTGLGTRVAGGVGFALVFGAALHYMATPDQALRPEAGALIIALFATVIAAPLLTGVCQLLQHGEAATE